MQMADVEHRWNRNCKGKTELRGEIPSQCHFGHHKSHMISASIEHKPPRWKAGE